MDMDIVFHGLRWGSLREASCLLSLSSELEPSQDHHLSEGVWND